MSGLLPSSSEVEPPEGEPQVIGVDDEDAERLLSALSSETARELFATIHDEPATPSELADGVDTSLQNAQYHLGKLEEADLIEVADTRYSAKGREMNVYAPSGAPVVLFAGSSDDGENVKSVLTNLLGGVGVLGLASLVVQRLFGEGPLAPTAGGGGGGDAGAAPTTTTTASDVGIMAEETETAAETTVAQTTVADQAATAAERAAALEPGLVFFLGGLLVLTMVGAAWYLRR